MVFPWAKLRPCIIAQVLKAPVGGFAVGNTVHSIETKTQQYLGTSTILKH